MLLEKLVVWITAAFFLGYGILFVFIPQAMSESVVSATIQSSSALIDTRATYGGMSIAMGVMMILLTSSAETMRLAVLSVVISMSAMAASRTLGILIDGDPNALMLGYLVAEIFAAVLAAVLLRRMTTNAPTSGEK
ncbi:MAG: hypothetical protein DHS20C12_28830 [Pseudohongiella sp.]|nr:MAG: hypothetical protein DHS20C12_28830 [Pseudohongiella sp.]